MIECTEVVARLDCLEALVIGSVVLFSLERIIGVGLVAWRGRRVTPHENGVL